MFLLGENWYQIDIQGGSKIPELPPNFGSCGTDYPGWMSDQHPTVVGQTKSVKFCIKSFRNCEISLFGKVTNCGGSFSYYLPETKPGTSKSRYCVE